MPLGRFSRGPPLLGHSDIPGASPEKIRDSRSRVDTIPMGHASVAARMSIDAGFDSGAAGASTTATGFHPAPLPLWSCHDPPHPITSPYPSGSRGKGSSWDFPCDPFGFGPGTAPRPGGGRYGGICDFAGESSFAPHTRDGVVDNPSCKRKSLKK